MRVNRRNTWQAANDLSDAWERAARERAASIADAERSEARNRAVIAATAATAAVAATVTVLRVSPTVLLAVAGRTQIGRALAACRN